MKLNIRQQKYKQNRLKGLSAYRSAIEAGYAHATAWNAHKNIEKRCNFDELLIRGGIDDQSLIAVINRGVQSMNAFGNPTNTAKMFVEIALKLKGRLKDSESPGHTTQVNVYPTKTIIFKDIDDTRDTSTRSLHESEGAEGTRPAIEI